MKKVKFLFTFGYGQKNKGKYVVIEGITREDCRNEMIRRFGMEWANIYPYYRLSQMQKAGLTEYG